MYRSYTNPSYDRYYNHYVPGNRFRHNIMSSNVNFSASPRITRSTAYITGNNGRRMFTTTTNTSSADRSSRSDCDSEHGGSFLHRLRHLMFGDDSCARNAHAYTEGDVGAQEEEPDAAKTLMVKELMTNLAENSTNHHTSEYDVSSDSQPRPKLVVRRGHPFTINIQFNRPYDNNKDDLKLVFQAGPQPLKSKGTCVELLLNDKDIELQWGAKVVSSQGGVLSVAIFTPPNLFVGKWMMNIEVVEKEGGSNTVFSYQHPDPIYIIFNAWCKDDPVYVDDRSYLDEYVLNETGKIYAGTSSNITAKPWNFGQFEAFVLDVALYLMDIGGLKWTVRGNPIAVVRKLTAMVNSSDDNGVLVGNWGGNYEGGKSPLSWTGSPAILKRYWLDKKPVRYGQCWIFSGILTSLMRALGIPARSVTNFSSAHDTDGSISIDYHFNWLGEPDETMDEDSVWNFHVWNEVWMSRPDLPLGYGGWQVLDATPQETSDGVYVCGPASVEAIKQGEVNLPYDAPFVFAEVNADVVHWINDSKGLNPVSLQKNSVGKFISTKACNGNERQDLTNCYKPAEGSVEERAAVVRANQTGASTKLEYLGNNADDVSFTVEHDPERTWVGHDFVIGLRMKNNSSWNRTINGRVVVKAMYYTGVSADRIKSEVLSSTPQVVKPGKELFNKIVVKTSDYLDKLKDGCMMDVTFWARITESGQVFTSKNEIRLRKPHLLIKAPKEAEAGKQFMVEISFINPLDKTLTDCTVEVDGLSKDLSFPQGNLPAKGTFSASLPVTALKKGQKELIIIFSSKQLADINGSHQLFIHSS